MTDLESMLAAIRAAPAEDTPRLMLADLLDESGRPEMAARADFIRCQIELVRFESFDPSHRKEFNEQARVALEKRMTRLERGDSESIKIARAIEEGGRLYRERYESLCIRDWELWKSHGEDWLFPIPGRKVTVLANADGYAAHIGGNFQQKFHRGFLSRIRCSWADASQHLDSILADPWVPGLDEVELTTWPEDVRSLCVKHGLTEDSPRRPGSYLTRVALSREWPQVRSWKLPPEPRERAQNFVQSLAEGMRALNDAMPTMAELAEGMRRMNPGGPHDRR